MNIIKLHCSIILQYVLFIQVFHVQSQFEGELLKFKLSAMSLPNNDLEIEGQSDPYVILFESTRQDADQANHWRRFGQTAPVKDTLNPVWDEVFSYQYINGTDQTWRFFVNDKDVTWIKPIDDPLGRVDIKVVDYLNHLEKRKEDDTYKPVQVFLDHPIGGVLLITPVND